MSTNCGSSDTDGDGGSPTPVEGNDVFRVALSIIIPLVVIAVILILVLFLAVCLPLVFCRRRRDKQPSPAASLGKPGIPVIFAEELNPVPGEEPRIQEDSDDDLPVSLPPEYRAATKSPADNGAEYKLLLVASSESEDSDNEDVELNRQHQPSDSLRRRRDEPGFPQHHHDQDIQYSLPQYAGPLLKPVPEYALAYAHRR